jgi:hypothetical protein
VLKSGSVKDSIAAAKKLKKKGLKSTKIGHALSQGNWKSY